MADVPGLARLIN